MVQLYYFIKKILVQHQNQIYNLNGSQLLNEKVEFVNDQALISLPLEKNKIYIIRVNESSTTLFR